MKPIGPLMVEHRIIERMVKLLKDELSKIKERNRLDPVFIDVAIDFFRTYADRTHHGKEEDILFRDLAKKKLSQEHERIMNELIQEHVYARKTVGSLLDAKENYVKGDNGALKDVTARLTDLIELYPRHIEKEDKHFFVPSMRYFSKKEQDDMLKEFWEFDRNMIHEKYKKIVERFEEK